MSGTLQNPSSTLPPGEAAAAPTRPRILLVTRRLWPLVGETETGVLQLAAEMREQGALPTVVTARWQTQWAERSSVRGVPVVRLPWPATPGWGLLRYLYSLSRFVRHNRREFDAVVVSGLRAEAFCVLASLPSGDVPVVLRASEAGSYGDVAWQRQARFGSRIAARCKRADAILASSRFVVAELQQADYPAERIHFASPSIFEAFAPRTDFARRAARKALAEANHDLDTVGDAPVVLCVGSLRPNCGLETLIRAWPPIQHRWPHARLWIVGDGPWRETLWRLLCDLDVRYRVLLPGSFDDWGDLLAAADVLVAPSPQPSETSVLRAAMTAGVAVVAANQPEHGDLIVPEKTGLLYEDEQRNSLTLALTRMLDNPELTMRLASAARETSGLVINQKESRWLLDWVATHRDRSGCSTTFG